MKKSQQEMPIDSKKKDPSILHALQKEQIQMHKVYSDIQ
jgi:hypothetical protein